MNFDPPLPAKTPQVVLDTIPGQLAEGKFLVLGFSKGDTLTHFLAFPTERERNAAASAINQTPGSHVRLFSPTA